MSKNSEDFQKHAKENAGYYRSALENGIITHEDFKAAGNADGKYSYAEQDEALKRINEAFSGLAKQFPDEERLHNFVAGIPTVKTFTPNKEDWLDYNQEQMARLAEQMKFNWNNKEDRSEMLKILANETIMRDKQKLYEDYKKEHPVASFINENILAPNSSVRLSRGEDITDTDVALDLANVGTYVTPGALAKGATRIAGKAVPTITKIYSKLPSGKTAKVLDLGSDALAQGIVEAASDVNLGNELGLHNIVAPITGAVVGTSAETLPRLAKLAVDTVTGGFGGELGKPASDAAEKFITKYFGDEVSAARASLLKDELERQYRVKNGKTVRKNASKKTIENLKRRSEDITPNADINQEVKDKWNFANHPNLWSKVAPSMSDEYYNKLMSDPRFKLVVRDVRDAMDLKKAVENATTKKEKLIAKTKLGLRGTGGDAIRGVSRNAGRGTVISYVNNDRKENAVPTVEELFASPELLDYFRLKKLGYDVQIPSKYKDREKEIEETKSRIEKLYGF